MQHHKISVIVPVYNAEKFLLRCAQSILGQTYENIELILVNDGSKDDSLRICRQIAEGDARVKVLDKPNGGAASARNLGLDHATGDFIGFCDADDYFEHHALECMLNIMLEHDLDTLECGAKCLCVDGAVVDPGKNDGSLFIESPLDSIRKVFNREGNVSLAVRLTKREAIEGIRIPEGRRVEDFYFTILLLLKVRSNAILNRTFYNCILSDGSVTRSATGSIYMDALYFYHRSVEKLEAENIQFPTEQLYYRMKMYYLLAISMTNAERRAYKEQIASFKKDIRKNRGRLNGTALTRKEKMILQLATVSFTACRLAYLAKNGR